MPRPRPARLSRSVSFRPALISRVEINDVSSTKDARLKRSTLLASSSSSSSCRAPATFSTLLHAACLPGARALNAYVQGVPEPGFRHVLSAIDFLGNSELMSSQSESHGQRYGLAN